MGHIFRSLATSPIADVMEKRDPAELAAADSDLDWFVLTTQQGKQPSRREAILRWSSVSHATNHVVWIGEEKEFELVGLDAWDPTP